MIETIASVSAFTFEFRMANSEMRSAQRWCSHSDLFPSNAWRRVSVLAVTCGKQCSRNELIVFLSSRFKEYLSRRFKKLEYDAQQKMFGYHAAGTPTV